MKIPYLIILTVEYIIRLTMCSVSNVVQNLCAGYIGKFNSSSIQGIMVPKFTKDYLLVCTEPKFII